MGGEPTVRGNRREAGDDWVHPVNGTGVKITETRHREPVDEAIWGCGDNHPFV
jgi:hypothetical protein